MINLRVGCALLMATGLVLLPVSGFAGNSDFSAGTSFGRSNGNVTKAEMEKAGNNIGEYVPEFDRGKAEQQYGGYYGGVKGGGRDMNAPGSEQFNSTEWGKAIQENKRKAPDMPGVSPGDEFLKQGQKAIDNAQNMFDPNMCKSVSFDKITTLKKTCERDLEVAQSCTRTASITGHYENTTEMKEIVIPSQDIAFSSSGAGYTGTWKAPMTGRVVSATATWSWNKRLAFGNPNWFMRVTTPFGLIPMDDETGSMALGSGAWLTEGEPMVFSVRTQRDQPATDFVWKSKNMRYSFTVTLRISIPAKKWVPEVVWNESCPFSKSEGALIKSECKVPGGTKTVVVDGVSYPVTQPCWQYEDTYRSQSATEGTCGSLNNDRACTRIGVECQDMNEGICYSQKEIWQCQSPSTGKGQICGDELFCQDGTCVESQTKTNNRFAEAVSALAMLAAAGEDAKGDSMNIRVFTGKPQACRKAMAGFNNCCQSGGWGGDVGLAHCSDEEKALGKAREKGITIQVGTYCSNKVLGVCLQKKTSYCVFDSKLAKIAQEQGRGGQLGIGFGGASSPDCRGMTVEELSRLRFDNMDFSSFFDELSSKSNVPQDQQLLDRVSNSLKGFTGKYDPDKNQNPSIPIN
jgi:conjugal transfer mating pair stabilization protein TraN